MRRKDREVTSITEITDILQRCDTVRIAMCRDGKPYVVPVSFGMEIREGKPVIWFHSAREGEKNEILSDNPYVCVEADHFFCVQKTVGGITTRYESVIGKGKCEEVTDMIDIRKGLKLLLNHYGYEDYDLDRCKGILHLKMYRIVLDEISGKHNPVE